MWLLRSLRRASWSDWAVLRHALASVMGLVSLVEEDDEEEEDDDERGKRVDRAVGPRTPLETR